MYCVHNPILQHLFILYNGGNIIRLHCPNFAVSQAYAVIGDAYELFGSQQVKNFVKDWNAHFFGDRNFIVCAATSSRKPEKAVAFLEPLDIPFVPELGRVGAYRVPQQVQVWNERDEPPQRYLVGYLDNIMGILYRVWMGIGSCDVNVFHYGLLYALARLLPMVNRSPTQINFPSLIHLLACLSIDFLSMLFPSSSIIMAMVFSPG